MKKALCLLMSMLLVFSVFSFCVSAADKTYGDYQYSVRDDGTVKIVKYTGDDKKVTIPEKIKGKTVTSLGRRSFYDVDTLEEVIIPKTIETINNLAFQGCSYLERITIENGVKSIKYGAFFGCRKLESIVIPDSVTEMGGSIFFNCKALKEIKLSKNLTRIGSFILLGSGYSKKEANWDGNLLYVGEYLVQAKQAYLSGTVKIKNGTVLIAGETLSGHHDSRLEKVILPESLRYIGNRAFKSCIYLEKVVFNKNIETIGEQAFVGCTSLKNVEIPESVKKIGEKAFGFSNRTHVDADLKVIEGFTITGYANTEAEKYAEKNEITFNCKKPKTPKVKISAKNRKIKVKYTKATGADGFQVRYTRNGKTTTKTYNTLKSVTKSTAKLSKGTYKVKVRAFAKTEGKKLYSKWTLAKTVKIA